MSFSVSQHVSENEIASNRIVKVGTRPAIPEKLSLVSVIRNETVAFRISLAAEDMSIRTFSRIIE